MIAQKEGNTKLYNFLLDIATKLKLVPVSDSNSTDLGATLESSPTPKIGRGNRDPTALITFQYNRNVVQLGDAAFAGDVRAVSALIKAGADVNGGDAEGFTALHRAVTSGSIPVTELLLSQGADPNTKDIAGCTPLHYAAFSGLTDIAHMLITGGADPQRKNKDGLTAADIAKLENKVPVYKLLTGTWTHVENLDFGHGVILEGELKVKRSETEAKGFASSFFQWKSKYVVLSRHYRALFIWNGNPTHVEGPVTRCKLENIDAIIHDAKSGSKKFTIRPTKGDPLYFNAASVEDATAWCAAIRAIMVAIQEEESKNALYRQLIADTTSPIPTSNVSTVSVPARVPTNGATTVPVTSTVPVVVSSSTTVGTGSVTFSTLPSVAAAVTVPLPTSAVTTSPVIVSTATSSTTTLPTIDREPSTLKLSTDGVEKKEKKEKKSKKEKSRESGTAEESNTEATTSTVSTTTSSTTSTAEMVKVIKDRQDIEKQKTTAPIPPSSSATPPSTSPTEVVVVPEPIPVPAPTVPIPPVTVTPAKPPMDPKVAISMLQKVVRGYRVRKLVRGWIRVVDKTDGDIYWYHKPTKTSSWFPPGHKE